MTTIKLLLVIIGTIIFIHQILARIVGRFCHFPAPASTTPAPLPAETGAVDISPRSGHNVRYNNDLGLPSPNGSKIISRGCQMCDETTSEQPNSAVESQVEEGNTQPKAATVLIVDDNIAEAAACRGILEYAGYDVLLATDGRQGLQALQANPQGIDLIILDWILPDMSGDEWLDHFLEVAPDVKVVFVSGKFIPEDIRNQLETKVCDFLKKPFTGTQLLQAIEKCLPSDNS